MAFRRAQCGGGGGKYSYLVIQLRRAVSFVGSPFFFLGLSLSIYLLPHFVSLSFMYSYISWLRMTGTSAWSSLSSNWFGEARRGLSGTLSSNKIDWISVEVTQCKASWCAMSLVIFSSFFEGVAFWFCLPEDFQRCGKFGPPRSQLSIDAPGY